MPDLTWDFPPDVPTRDLLRTYDLSDPGCLGMLRDNLARLIGPRGLPPSRPG